MEETFRFVCPNNPAAREKTVRQLRELLARNDFAGVFLDKIRSPSPANSADGKCCHVFAAIAGMQQRTCISTSTPSSKSSPMARSTPALCDQKQRETKPPSWLDALVAGSPILSHFLRFRANSVAALVAELAGKSAAPGAEGFCLTCSHLASPPWSARTTGASKQHCDWAKPMTYRLALGPAGLRLRDPRPGRRGRKALRYRRGAYPRLVLPPRRFGQNHVPGNTGVGGSDLSFIQAEIEVAVRTLAPTPVDSLSGAH